MKWGKFILTIMYYPLREHLHMNNSLLSNIKVQKGLIVSCFNNLRLDVRLTVVGLTIYLKRKV